MPATFRQASEADAAIVAEVIEQAYEHYIPILGGRKPRPMTDDHPARIARGETFIIEDRAEPVGVTSMHHEQDAIHIFNIAIRPEAQGRGLLRQVFAFAEDLARQRDAVRLALYTNALMERNRTIYAHLGFEEVRQEDAPGGYRIVYFQRAIGPA